MFENSIFKIEFSILLGLFPHHNLYRLTFQSFVLREWIDQLLNTFTSIYVGGNKNGLAHEVANKSDKNSC